MDGAKQARGGGTLSLLLSWGGRSTTPLGTHLAVARDG